MTRVLNVFICVILTLLLASCSDSDNNTTNTTPEPPQLGTPPPETESPTFMETHYRTGHNSYSGNLHNGYRGSIIQQLDAGLRFVELDIHLRFNDEGNVVFKVGHDDPGNQVDHTNGNPGSSDCQDWISVVKYWVDNNQPTEPVILAFDWKSGFDKDNEEDQSAIQTLHGYFTNNTHSTYLYPKDFDVGNEMSQYHTRIMVLLSGNESAREYYLNNYCFSDSKCSDTNAPPVAQMFVEYQPDNDKTLTGDEGELFYARAFKDGGCDWAKEMEGNHFTRLWLLDSPCDPKVPNLPATNFPYFGWYARYIEDLSPIPAFDSQDVAWCWLDPRTPGKGSNPDVAVNNLGFVVEVHKSQNGDTLWCKAGKINGNSIDWRSEDKQYDGNGQNPSVVLTDTNLVVEIHSNGSGDLYYKCGRLNAGDGSDGSYTISWAKGEHEARWYDDGKHPWLAINENNTVVEVHEGFDEGYGHLWYNVGTVHDSDDVKSIDITWHGIGDDYRKYYDGLGARPTVAVHGNLVFEAHNDLWTYPEVTLWCQIGELDSSGQRINWKIPGLPQDSAYAYKTTYPYPIDQPGSRYPTVALNSTGALEAHMAGSDIWWRAGKQSNSVMAVGPNEKIGANASGTEISIDASDTHAVLAYISGESDIYYMVGDLE